ncbi:MAG: AAA family ATPase [Desulfotomaculaceae bacterium]|nr:AAA family ATPase [Desulfotomaculaceae bacterium]MDD4766983.1 AAA family ATPase [Desulfotomaculaceae bacterium]
MSDYQIQLQEEQDNLEKTLSFLRQEIENMLDALSRQKSDLISLRKDMWENTVHFSNDFARLTEITHYLAELDSQSANYGNTSQRLEKYRKMLLSPYFGRFDFHEDGWPDTEKIYIGLHNVVDSKTSSFYVYDWRAPISSIFYQFEPGRASYQAPAGTISGEVTLKRQYKIQDAQLQYFFDCRVGINDEILQEALRGKASARMRYIVETIQKEQDAIIRDTENELLIVQGVAGSGKTSVALHRIAFLLYHGLNSNLKSNNILILSPNNIFSKYISSVLPELGEENTLQTTFEDIALKLLDGRLKTESRSQQLESMISAQNQDNLRMRGIAFKGSRQFAHILDRLISHCENNMIDFEDIYFDGKILMTRQQLKNMFIKDKTIMPIAKRLKRIENIILEKVQPLRKKRLKKIEEFVAQTDGHELEIKPFSRLLSIKKSRSFVNRIHRYTEVDYLSLYRTLFLNDELFARLASGLQLPDNIGEIIAMTRDNLAGGTVFYEDCAPLLYLKLRLEGSSAFSGISQVVIDEAQDYDLIHYEIFKLLFGEARFTVLGDIHQAIDKDVSLALYDHIIEIMSKRKSAKVILNKGYRSSYEINSFNQKILGDRQNFIPFERHETEPVVVSKDTLDKYDRAIIREIADAAGRGYESVAVICKTAAEAEKLHSRLKDKVNIKLVTSGSGEIEKGAIVIPSYLAKGLEFDVVLAGNVSSDNFNSELDQKLLYIICTRALHRLTIFHTGEKSPLIET